MGDPEAMWRRGGGTLGILIKNGIETFLGSLGDFELFYCPL